MPKSIYLILLTMILTTACAKDGATGPQGPAGPAGASQTASVSIITPKPLFSYWTAPGDGLDIDLTNGRFNTAFLGEIDYYQGTVCTCSMMIAGDDTSGSFSMVSCTVKSGSPNPQHGCDTFPAITYQRQGDTGLLWCGGGSCMVLTDH